MSKPFKISTGIEKKILSRFGGAGLHGAWWKSLQAEFRHCFKCGGALEWVFVKVEERDRFVCGSCQTISYQNPKLVAATLPVRGDKIYLLRRAIEPGYGLWSYPAGYMELAETVEEAAARETWEEIRAKVKIIGNPQVYSYPDAAVITVVYLAKVLTKIPKPGPESLEVKAFRKEEIPWLDLAFRSTYHALRDWVTQSK